MDEVAALLAGYPFDVLLGSVHWIGNFMFDVLEDPEPMAEWDRRGTEATWRAYTDALVELSETATCAGQSAAGPATARTKVVAASRSS